MKYAKTTLFPDALHGVALVSGCAPSRQLPGGCRQTRAQQRVDLLLKRD